MVPNSGFGGVFATLITILFGHLYVYQFYRYYLQTSIFRKQTRVSMFVSAQTVIHYATSVFLQKEFLYQSSAHSFLPLTRRWEKEEKKSERRARKRRFGVKVRYWNTNNSVSLLLYALKFPSTVPRPFPTFLSFFSRDSRHIRVVSLVSRVTILYFCLVVCLSP